ncbi:MAG: succinate dehydrogenase, cytochrome b556 subunit [Steroidobacterales bacterium]
MHERPLSPHWTVYRFGYTMSLSLLHLITGVALAFGLFALIAWLMGAAGGENSYAQTVAVLSLLPLKALLGLGLIALIYHLFNGLRHLAWDAGWGFERRAARGSAALVVAATVIAAAVVLYFAFRMPAGTP